MSAIDLIISGSLCQSPESAMIYKSRLNLGTAIHAFLSTVQCHE